MRKYPFWGSPGLKQIFQMSVCNTEYNIDSAGKKTTTQSISTKFSKKKHINYANIDVQEGILKYFENKPHFFIKNYKT